MTFGSTAGPDADRSRKSFRVALASIVLVALGLRIAAVLWIPTQPVSDFWSYRFFALTLLRTGALPGWASIYGPGYPLWLAGVARVFGPELVAARLVNCVLSAIAAGLAGLLARRLFGPWSGLLAAGLLCIDPRQILQSCLLASENLASPLMFIFLLLAAMSWRAARPLRLAAIAGITIGLVSLTRPAMQPLFLLWPLSAILASRPILGALKETALMAVMCFATLVPWGAWNLRNNHRWLLSNSGFGPALYKGNHPGATGQDFDWRPAVRAVRPDLDLDDPIAVDRVVGDLARSWIAAHPLSALHLYIHKLGLYFWGVDARHAAYWAISARHNGPPTPPVAVLPESHFLRKHVTSVEWLLRGWYFGSLAAGLIATGFLVFRLRDGRSSQLRAGVFLLVGACAIFALVASAFVVIDRYRWPSEDILCVLISGLVASTLRPAGSRPKGLA